MMADIRFYLSLFRRRLGWFLGVSALVTALAVVAALMMPPTYLAAARLVVESEKIPDELAASTVQTKAVEHLEIIEQRVLSREALLDMSSRLAIFGNTRPSPDDIVLSLRERITFNIQPGQKSRREPEGATMLSVAFRDGDPVMTAAVTNELVTRILAEDVAMRTTVARQTLEFFDQEVSRLEASLSRTGATLLSFQEANRDILPETRDFRGQRILALQSELDAMAREIDDLTRERRRMVRLHESLRRTQNDTYANVLSYEARQIAALRETLEELPEGDPGAADIATRIASLTRRLEQEGRTDAVDARRTAFHDRVEEIDTRIREAEDRRLALLDEISGIEQSAAEAPSKIAELASLEQDHANIRALYNNALEARALAETGDAIETLSKGQRIAVIEQAVTPRIPVSPGRKMVAAGGGVIGIFAGLLVVLLLELRLGFLRRPVDLTKRLGITPIATLPNLDAPEPIRPSRLRSPRLWLSLGGLAIVLAAAGVAADEFDLLYRGAKMLRAYVPDL